MALFVLNITQDDILTELRSFLLTILTPNYPDVEVIQGQVNRVPEPATANFIVMTPLHNARLSTNVDSWDTSDPAPTEIEAERDTQMSIQLDIHGPFGSDMAQVVATLWRSGYGVETIDGGVFTPLYASDGRQVPFINGENQFENRWIMTVELQVKPTVSTPMEFADTITASVISPADGA